MDTYFVFICAEEETKKASTGQERTFSLTPPPPPMYTPPWVTKHPTEMEEENQQEDATSH